MDLKEIAKSEEMSIESVPFPQVVATLAAAGVESYYTDLVRLEKTFYGAAGDAHAHHVPLTDAPKIAAVFSASDVRAALAAIQKRQIGYPQFLRRIMAAGTMGYLVFIVGQRVLYFGRDGRSHLELFPGAAQDT